MVMILRVLIIALAGTIVVASTAPHCGTEEPSCPRNQHYVSKYKKILKTCGNRLINDRGVPEECAPYTGCICDDGFVRRYDNATGPCIRSSKCARIPKKCPKNEEPSSCAIICPPQTCESIFTSYDCPKRKCEPGCNCINNYLRKDGVCIDSDKCFDDNNPSCPKHEHYVTNDEACIKTCGNRLLNNADTAGACVPYTGCVCDDGYVRRYDNGTGPCIPVKKCAPIPASCPANEQRTSCRRICPPQTCESRLALYKCAVRECEPGCDCIENYLRNKDGVCIDSRKCPGDKPVPPACGPNEIASDCARVCPPQSCDSMYLNYLCAFLNCSAGCDCIDGYLRNDDGVCIPSSLCPPSPYMPIAIDASSQSPIEPVTEKPAACKGDHNATMSDCPSACQATCDDPRTNKICTLNCLEPGCVCKPGYVKNKVGKCIKLEDCPGKKHVCTDPNASWTECTSACPRSCADRFKQISCIQMCMEPGCQCNPGYYLNDRNICVLPHDCPNCKGDYNATMSDCPTPCPATCDAPSTNKICTKNCLEPGCVCRPGFVKNDLTGKCIIAEDCPGSEYGCPARNATYKECRTSCPARCPKPGVSDINSSQVLCIEQCREPGCECNSGYVLDPEENCVLPKDCPGKKHVCTDPNASWTECTSACPPSCADRFKQISCIEMCMEPGCQCNPGYYLNDKNICVLPDDCPNCKGDYNATMSDCPTPCPATCDAPSTNKICTKNCLEPGCVCRPGFVKNDLTGKCIIAEDCPGSEFGCSTRNATYKECRSSCPARCPKPGSSAVDSSQVLCTDVCREPGCECKSGYVLDAEDRCLLPEDCPKGVCKDPNASWSECTSACPPTCADRFNPRMCIAMCMPPGCQCNNGYYLDSNGKCVLPEHCPSCKGDYNATMSESPPPCPATCAKPESNQKCKDKCSGPGCVCNSGFLLNKDGGKCIIPDDCPGGSPSCPKNETYTRCKVGCPTNNCPESDIRAVPACSPPYPCPPGCICLGGYLRRNDNKRCVLSTECPPVKCTRLNEEWSPSLPNCLADRCEDREGNSTDCPVHWPSGRPACVCKKGYYRNASDICVPASECPPICHVPMECRRTCASPNPPNCPYNPPKSNIDGCDCQEGYILSGIGGNCIKIEDCPNDTPCNGDPNARPKRCPRPCPSTCDTPNAVDCKKMCEPIGCECKEVYLFNKDGKCVLPDDCPCGNPCGPNGVFSSCRHGCPQDFCPVDDDRGILLCKPPRDCLSGCRCKVNHRWISYENRTCIESATCPPVDCTRPNELWDECPSDCLAEMCEDVHNKPTVCNTLLLNCQPKCVCKKGHFRNKSDICVPAAECSPTCSVPPKCRRTCNNPNPPDCPYNPPKSNMDGCDCKEGYILSEDGGKCIKYEDCLTCKGDPHAKVKPCPPPCPSTCSRPNAVPCKKACEVIGCECEPGYIYSEKDCKCVLPDKCPGGNPCGKNSHFARCRYNCPEEYCPEPSTIGVVCDPPQFCLSGCVCDFNHRRLNHKNDTCIPTSSCPPLKCKNPNEVWNKCPSPCLAEGCADVNNQPSACNTLLPVACDPRCVCKKNHFRDGSNICVPAKDCPEIC